MTEEEKERVREKDRLRKAAKTVAVKEKKPSKYCCERERENNRKYKEKKRQGQSEGEAELERIENLLIKRKTRAGRSKEQIERDKVEAREGMKFEKILPFKKRRPFGRQEEYLWWKFWQKSFENKELLRKKHPEFAERFEEWEAKSKNPYAAQEEEEEYQSSMTDQEKLAEKNQKRKIERQRILEELRKPIDMPEMEKCEYELIREKNIAVIQEAMKESGLFENLN